MRESRTGNTSPKLAITSIITLTGADEFTSVDTGQMAVTLK